MHAVVVDIARDADDLTPEVRVPRSAFTNRSPLYFNTGTTLNRRPDSSDAAAVNPSTTGSITISSSRGRVSGRSATINLRAATATPNRQRDERDGGEHGGPREPP